MNSASASSCAEPVRGWLPYIDGAALEQLVPMIDAVTMIESALRAPDLAQPPRSVTDVVAGQLLLMPAQSAERVGVKIAAVAPNNPKHGLDRIQGVYVLMDADTLVPVALLDGVALTNLRTPAVSAVATARLATPETEELVVFGAGPQAWGHVLAMQAVRPMLRRVRVVGRSPGRVEALLARIHALGLEAAAAGPEAVADADIICTCTSATEPLFDGALLPAHAQVVAVGSHLPNVREVDISTVRRAQVVVEERGAALREAGDLVLAMEDPAIDKDHIRADLRELVGGCELDPYALTLFKSVGMAWEDLAVAALAHERFRVRQP